MDRVPRKGVLGTKSRVGCFLREVCLNNKQDAVGACRITLRIRNKSMTVKDLITFFEYLSHTNDEEDRALFRPDPEALLTPFGTTTGAGSDGCRVDSPVTDLSFDPCPKEPFLPSAEVANSGGNCSEVSLGFEGMLSSVLEQTQTKVREVLEESSEPLGSMLTDNPYAVLAGCTLSEGLRRKALTLVKWFSKVMRESPERDPPDKIECGGLRAAVESCFPGITDPLRKLSFKTVQKVEKSCCDNCRPRFMGKLDQWREARAAPVSVDVSDLERFRTALRMNVDRGWDKRRRIFIPNGNATRVFKRKQGGNWNIEPFSDQCRTELVFSSGKPRVVTLYSAENTRRLGPLHYSLYESLRRKGWLLVGDPTDKHVQHLTGAAFLSFDYQSATDNIKCEYVRAAIEVLKERADHLDDSEIEALDVLGRLNLGDCEASSGQPMGSVMSFPLLCLINKTVVDLAMNRLLIGGEIGFNEWSKHPCLINGDDLLIREPRSTTNLRALIVDEGRRIGLVVNEEKTLVSDSDAEINSTYFKDGCRQRKFNAAAVWMDAGTEDVLGFAAQACSDGATFKALVRSNRHILAKQQYKGLERLPGPLQGICRTDPRIRKAVTSLPESIPTVEQGVISMAQRPENYNLSRDEEYTAMKEEIMRVRERAIRRCLDKKPKFKTRAIPNACSFSSVLKRRKPAEQDLIPACYVRWYKNKILDALVAEEVADLPPLSLPPGDGSLASIFIDNLRAYNLTRKQAVRIPDTEFASNADCVSLAC